MSTPPLATVDQFKAEFPREFVYGKGLDTVQDSDITRALQRSALVFNRGLWRSEADARIPFLLLAAHNLALAVQAAGGLSAKNRGRGIKSTGRGPIASKSVGGMSVTYALTPMVTESPILAPYAKTEFGCLYLELLCPKLIGNVGVVAGDREPDVAGFDRGQS